MDLVSFSKYNTSTVKRKKDNKNSGTSLLLSHASIPVNIVRRQNQKHVRIRVSADGTVTLSAPRQVSMRYIREVLRRKEEWINSKLREHSGAFRRIDPRKQVFLEGQAYRVIVQQSSEQGGRLRCRHDETVVELQAPQPQSNEVEYLIAQWLKDEAHRRLKPLARRISDEVGIPFGKIFLRNQKSRWGSSSSAGNISLNWRVVMLPPPLQRYLIVHELAHQNEMNHSHRYWSLVKKLCPDYPELEKELKARRFLMGLFRF